MLQRHRFEPAVEVIGPAVIAALEFLGMALVIGDDQRAAMSALIVDDADLAFGVAHQHHRLLADEGGEIVARLLHLAFMADIDPGGAEDALHFEIENGGIGIDAAMNARRLHQGSKRFRGRHKQLLQELARAYATKCREKTRFYRVAALSKRAIRARYLVP